MNIQRQRQNNREERFAPKTESRLARKLDYNGDQIWKEDEQNSLELNTALPEDVDEVFSWTDRTQNAVSTVANEITQLKAVQEQTDATLNILDKRQRITEARVAKPTENEQRKQRQKVGKMLDMRGLCIPGNRRLSTAQERDATFKWVAEQLRMNWDNSKRTHRHPGRTAVTDKTRLTFEAVEDLREWKKPSTI